MDISAEGPVLLPHKTASTSSTSPLVAGRMLDLLPDEVWSNPDLKWLDPVCKTGIFLREAASPLMDGLAEVIEDEEQRRRHIFNEALAMTPEARAGDGPHVTFLRALARRLLDPAVMLPHGRVHVALDAEPELTPAEELELVGADVGRMGWEYR